MKIILVRHAETEANYEGIIQGQGLNGLLSNAGIRQAKKLSDKLKSTNIDLCYTSPMARTWQTAMILVGDRAIINDDKRLIERYLGSYEGVKKEDYKYKNYWDYKLNLTDGGVEPVQDLISRASSFLEEIKEKHPDKTVLIVSHSALIRALHHLIMKTDLNKNLLDIKIENCFCREYEI